jgi:hypothetical protein
VAIETAIFNNNQQLCSADYRERVRMIFLNLKSNANLRDRVRSEAISAIEFSSMSAEEMKSQEREEQDRKMQGLSDNCNKLRANYVLLHILNDRGELVSSPRCCSPRSRNRSI